MHKDDRRQRPANRRQTSGSRHLQPDTTSRSPAADIRNPASSIQHPTSSIKHPAPGIQHPESSTQHPASGIRHPASGIKHQASSIQYPAPSIQHPASSIRHPASGIRHQASSIQYPVSRLRPFIIPIFLPHAGCPHRCTFCDQLSITGARRKTDAAEQIRSKILEFLNYKTRRRKPVQISFFGGNFLGLNFEEIRHYLALADEFVRQGDVDGIRFSTRPDTVDRERLDIIADYPVAAVELGVQSMNDRVLALAKRGHNAADTAHAVAQLKERNYGIGLQMMVGLPGDDQASALNTARRIAGLRPDFVRIYPTVVLKNSRLAEWYSNGSYTPLSLDAAVTQVKNLCRLFHENKIRIIRMGLQASADLADGSTVLAGPYHPAFGHMVYSEIFLDAACSALTAAHPGGSQAAIFVNPRRISTMRGIRNSNVALLKRRFGFERIDIFPDISLDEDSLKIGNASPMSCFALKNQDADV